jgi:hypothetical protein
MEHSLVGVFLALLALVVPFKVEAVRWGTFREHFAAFRGHSGNIQGTFVPFREHSWNTHWRASSSRCLLSSSPSKLRPSGGGHSGHIQGTVRQHSGNIQGTFRQYSGNIQGTFRQYSGNIQGTFREHSLAGVFLVLLAMVVAFKVPSGRAGRKRKL